jgi:hypothetical protein
MTQKHLYTDVHPPWSPHQGLAKVVPLALFSCACQHNSNVSCPLYQGGEAWHMGTPVSSPSQNQLWIGASLHCCYSTHCKSQFFKYVNYAVNCSNYVTLVIDEWRSMEHQQDTDREKPKYSGEKPVPVPHHPPKIPHGLAWDKPRPLS